MQHTTESDQQSSDDFRELFLELIAVHNDEELYRIRHRLNKKLKIRLVNIITTEIQRRETLWQQEKRRGPEVG